MPFDPERLNRRSIRLPGYDYTRPGAYFVTIATFQRALLFGEVVASGMRLNLYGERVAACWRQLPTHYPYVTLDEFMIMPNHVHGLILLRDQGKAGYKPAPTDPRGLPEIVRGFKTFSARQVNAVRRMHGVPVWQRNYYEHVVRNEDELHRIREYIRNNPAQFVTSPITTRWHSLTLSNKRFLPGGCSPGGTVTSRVASTWSWWALPSKGHLVVVGL